MAYRIKTNVPITDKGAEEKTEVKTEEKVYQLKRDRYRHDRGGKVRLLDVSCNSCGSKVLVYQKDGEGQLRRCYLNRIFDPPEYESLQRRKDIASLKDLPNLTCPNCETVIGTPMIYSDGRLAFRLRPGFFNKAISDSKSVDR